MSRTAGALTALLVLAPACAEDSSFVLRWNVGRTAADAEVPLTSVRQCSDIGLSRVRVTTRTFEGEVEDTREFSCFPEAFADPDGTAPGPELPAGKYRVTIVGLTRRGIERDDPASTDEDDVLARDQRDVIVNERGEGVLADDFRLVGIDQCHDGIDNDRDGAVDHSDTPCRLGQTREDLDLSGALFTFTASLLTDLQQADCGDLDIDHFRVTLDPDGADPVVRDIDCSLMTQSFGVDLPPGEHTWQVEAVNYQGAVVTAPIPGEQPFVVPDQEFVVVDIEVDFGIESFVVPLVEPLRFSLELEPYPDAPAARECDPEPGSGYLTLFTIGLRLEGTTAANPDTWVPVDPPPQLKTLDNAEFPVTAHCDEFGGNHTTTDLKWGAADYTRYRLITEAFPVGTPTACFAQTTELTPGADLILKVPRATSEGVCADCCVDCDKRFACAGSCVDGVCMP